MADEYQNPFAGDDDPNRQEDRLPVYRAPATRPTPLPSVLSDTQQRMLTDAVNRLIQSNPELRQSLADPANAKVQQQLIGQALLDAGYPLPPEDYHFEPKQDGSITIKRENFWNRNLNWIAPALWLGTPGLVQWATAPAAAVTPSVAGGGGTTAATTAGTTATATGGTTAATAGGTTAATTGGTTAATGGSIWGTIGHGIARAVPEIAMGVTGLIGAKIGANAAKDAAEIQAKANADALASQERIAQAGLDLEGDIYKRRDAQLSPYRQIGSSATGSLNNLMGYAPITNTPVPEIRPVNIGATSAPGYGSLGSMQTSTQPGAVSMARVKAPNGQVYQVPKDRVQEAVQNGGQVV